jgi:hypothetical protein
MRSTRSTLLQISSGLSVAQRSVLHILASAMLDSPPLCPLPSIEIDTPPNSPFPQSVDQELGSSSVKRARTEFVDSENTPTKRTRQYTGHSARGVSRPGIQLPVQQLSPDASLASTASDSDSESDKRDNENDAYLYYVDLVLAGCIAIYQISYTVFVVQGWDLKCLSGTVSDSRRYFVHLILKQRSWYHLQRKRIGDEFASICFCPGIASGKCVHQMFVEDCGDEHFPGDGVLNNGMRSCTCV